MTTPVKKQTWMPHAGHLIIGHMCRFRLNTHVNGYIISTVGEYVPDSAVRKIYREVRGLPTDKIGGAEEMDFIKITGGVDGYGEEIGLDRKYETMVFRAMKSKRKCCPYEMRSADNIDYQGYNLAADAYKGHLKMVAKYAKKVAKKTANKN